MKRRLLLSFLVILAVVIPGCGIGYISINMIEENVTNEVEVLLMSQAKEWRIIVDSYESNICDMEEEARVQASEIIVSQAKIVYELIDNSLDKFRNNAMPFAENNIISRLSRHTVGRTGYIGILDYDGTYVLSRNRSQDGENILDVTWDGVQYPVKDIISTGMELDKAEVGFLEYQWANPGDPEPRQKISAILHFPEMQWIVAVTAYYDDIVYSNYRIDTVDELKNMIAQQEIGYSGGYIAVLDSQGRYVISLDRMRDGEDISQSTDADGRLYVQEGIKLAMEAGSDAETIRYPWLMPDTETTSEKIGGIVYYEPWDWIIWPNAYLDDFIDTSGLMRKIILIITVAALVAGFITYELALHFEERHTR